MMMMIKIRVIYTSTVGELMSKSWAQCSFIITPYAFLFGCLFLELFHTFSIQKGNRTRYGRKKRKRSREIWFYVLISLLLVAVSLWLLGTKGKNAKKRNRVELVRCESEFSSKGSLSSTLLLLLLLYVLLLLMMFSLSFKLVEHKEKWEEKEDDDDEGDDDDEEEVVGASFKP